MLVVNKTPKAIFAKAVDKGRKKATKKTLLIVTVCSMFLFKILVFQVVSL